MDIIDLCLHCKFVQLNPFEYRTKFTKKLEVKYINESSNMYYRHQSDAT